MRRRFIHSLGIVIYGFNIPSSYCHDTYRSYSSISILWFPFENIRNFILSVRIGKTGRDIIRTMITLHDLFIGNFPVSQNFGENYETYKWIKDYLGNPILGHNGVDFGYNGQSPILLNPFPKTSEVVCSFTGWDKDGYGWWLRLWDKTQSCVILYAHAQEINIKAGETIRFQQQVAIGDSTGWSTGPHLHCGFYIVDAQGNKLNRDNGYDGYLNVMNKKNVTWNLLNPTKPSDATPIVDCDPQWRIDRDKNWDLYLAEKEKVTLLQASEAKLSSALEQERASVALAKQECQTLKQRVLDFANNL